MERRKFIAGLGSLTAAGAAGIGTGAFTSVSANRGVSVDVADDNDAFLAIEAESTNNADEYVDVNGTVSLDFSNTDETQGANGSGLNKNADTIIRDLLQVTNQGTQDVIVGVSGLPEGMSIYTDDGDVAANGNSTSLNQDNYSPSSGNLALVGVGDTMDNVGVAFYGLNNDIAETVAGAEITFHAIAVDELENPQDVRDKY